MKYLYEQCDQIKKNETEMGVQQDERAGGTHRPKFQFGKSHRKKKCGKLDVTEKITLNVI